LFARFAREMAMAGSEKRLCAAAAQVGRGYERFALGTKRLIR